MRMMRLLNSDDKCTDNMKFNEGKTKLLEINIISESQIIINDRATEKLKDIKDFTLIIDKELKFKVHSEYTCGNKGKKLCFLSGMYLR